MKKNKTILLFGLFILLAHTQALAIDICDDDSCAPISDLIKTGAIYGTAMGTVGGGSIDFVKALRTSKGNEFMLKNGEILLDHPAEPKKLDRELAERLASKVKDRDAVKIEYHPSKTNYLEFEWIFLKSEETSLSHEITKVKESIRNKSINMDDANLQLNKLTSKSIELSHKREFLKDIESGKAKVPSQLIAFTNGDANLRMYLINLAEAGGSISHMSRLEASKVGTFARIAGVSLKAGAKGAVKGAVKGALNGGVASGLAVGGVYLLKEGASALAKDRLTQKIKTGQRNVGGK